MRSRLNVSNPFPIDENRRRMPLGRVRLDERRLDEVHSSATLGSCYAFHKDAKLYHCRSQRTALCYLSNFRINDFSDR